MVQTSELTRPPLYFPSTLKKLRLSGDFFFLILIFITPHFIFPLVLRGFYFPFVFKTLSLYITIMERKFIVSFHKGA